MLTADRVRKVLRYNKRTGIFVRLIAHKRNLIGQPTNRVDLDGYVRIRMDGKTYLAHRLAWLYVTGAWPLAEIDHKNRIRSDNRWCNLRAATRSQNQINAPARNTNILGVKGVRMHWTGRYEARLNQKHLGHFTTIKDARAAYLAAAKKSHGEFARSS